MTWTDFVNMNIGVLWGHILLHFMGVYTMDPVIWPIILFVGWGLLWYRIGYYRGRKK